MKNRIIGILGLLLFLSVVYNVKWVAYERNISDNTIAELNKGAEIDYAYVNQVHEHASALFELHSMCSSTLASSLKGEITDAEITEFMGDYTNQITETKRLQDLTVEMKKKRSEEFAKFKYVNVYRAE